MAETGMSCGRPSGAVVWLTGLPSAGKTTIAALVHRRLVEHGWPAEHLDGDVMRERLFKELGYARQDREDNVRRIGYIAGLLAQHGVIVLVSVVAPYRDIRNELRKRLLNFMEIHVATSLATCQARDVKGLYRRQARGELAGLTGVDDPYEPPLEPELVLRTELETPTECADRVLARLAEGDGQLRDVLAQPAVDGNVTSALRAQGDGQPVRPASLPPPHGGRLVNQMARGDGLAMLAAEAERLPVAALDGVGLSDLECLAIGAFSPLSGFLGRADYETILAEGRLANGLVWTLPVVLSVPPAALAGGPDRLALADRNGQVLAVLSIEEVYQADLTREAMCVYGTADPAHPGVVAVLNRPGPLVAGPVRVLRLPAVAAALGPRFTPAQTRAEAIARGWRSMVGFQTRNPVHRAHEYLHKVALEQVDGLLLHPLVGHTKDDDVSAELRMACYRSVLDGYYPSSRVLLSAFPGAMRYAGPREAVFHALVRKNYGCSHFIVGRDHAGVAGYYGPYEAQEAFDVYAPGELGILLMKFEDAFFCRSCDGMATRRTCPHPSNQRMSLSGTALRSLLTAGVLPPPQLTRPEPAQTLVEAYRAASLVR
jgi:sulfate adenylyltransferase/3'-phosphoadenosine 5'-phosphosulfate synthase